MASIVKRFWPCLRVIIESVNNQQPITYGELAERLGLKFAKQEWTNLLDLIAVKTKRELGDDYDLTWNVVYAKGNKAEGLSRYFSEGDQVPGTTLLDPENKKQVDDFERKLKNIYKYAYELKHSKVIKVRRPG